MKRTRTHSKTIALVGIGLLGGWMLFRGGTHLEEEAQPAPMPLVLEKVQALGNLHTARYTYQNVFEHISYRHAQDWAQRIPGFDSLVHNATRNSALVGVTAEVEAGVDLSKAKQEGSLIVLPPATIYEPQVHAHVYSTKRGAFWRDDNLALNAVDSAKERLIAAADSQKIRAEAERNAVSQVQNLLSTAGVANMTVKVGGA